MAILQSTGINGFLCSVKATGAKIMDAMGQSYGEMKEWFSSGFDGHGWKLWNNGTAASPSMKLEVDELTVRKVMTVFELIIAKVRAVNGGLVISAGCGRVKSARDTVAEIDGQMMDCIALEMEGDLEFVKDDYIMMQRWSGSGLVRYHVKVGEVVEGVVLVDKQGEFDGMGYVYPQAGDEVVQMGNATDTTRQCVIYLHAVEGEKGAIDILQGVNTRQWQDFVVCRLGGELPNGSGANGLWMQNGTVTSEGGDGMSRWMNYWLKPSGEAMFGRGKAMFRADGSGYLFDEDTVSWDAGGFRFGNGVTLDWNNLSAETQENLKGEKGDTGADGEPGEPGAPGADGKDANMLPWVEEWNTNATSINGERIATPKMFCGQKEADGTLTGVAIGKDAVWNATEGARTGIYMFDHGAEKVVMDPIRGVFRFEGDIQAHTGTFSGLTRRRKVVINNGNVEQYFERSQFSLVNPQKTFTCLRPRLDNMPTWFWFEEDVRGVCDEVAIFLPCMPKAQVMEEGGMVYEDDDVRALVGNKMFVYNDGLLPGIYVFTGAVRETFITQIDPSTGYTHVTGVGNGDDVQIVEGGHFSWWECITNEAIGNDGAGGGGETVYWYKRGWNIGIN